MKMPLSSISSSSSCFMSDIRSVLLPKANNETTMEQVTLYSESHELQRTDALHVLENYFRFVKWDPEVRSKILDVGCGDGDVTFHLLLPKIPKNFKQLVATDISEEMLAFAKTMCKNEKVTFCKLDVSAQEIPSDFHENFDHIFSFYCLHWVRNHRYSSKAKLKDHKSCFVYNLQTGYGEHSQNVETWGRYAVDVLGEQSDFFHL